MKLQKLVALVGLSVLAACLLISSPVIALDLGDIMKEAQKVAADNQPAALQADSATTPTDTKTVAQEIKLTSEENLAEIQRMAEAGDAKAQANLGVLYFNGGEGMPKDAAKAMEWFQKAAAQGNDVDQYNLGVLYFKGGEGVPKDAAKAMEWFQKAAAQGNAKAQTNLGWLYGNGEGVPKDASKAMEWYIKAAAQGIAVAQANIGEAYEKGEGVPKDAAKAVEWYQKAAAQGLAEAQESLKRLATVKTTDAETEKKKNPSNDTIKAILGFLAGLVTYIALVMRWVKRGMEPGSKFYEFVEFVALHSKSISPMVYDIVLRGENDRSVRLVALVITGGILLAIPAAFVWFIALTGLYSL